MTIGVIITMVTTNPQSGINIPYTRLKYVLSDDTKLRDVNAGESNRETNEEAMKWGDD